MPNRPCQEPGCPNLAAYRGRCLRHANVERGPQRKANKQTYNSKRWRITRRKKLNGTPLCERCGHVATDVHHKHGVESKPFDLTTLESLCHACHSRITRFQQVGEGRSR